MVHLSCHTATHATEHHVRNRIHDTRQRVVTLAFSEHTNATQDKRKVEQTIAAPNQPHVVLVHPQPVLLPHHVRRRGHRRPGTQTRLQAHTRYRTRLLPHRTGLEAAAPAEVPLAAAVVGPSAARIDVVEGAVAGVDCGRAEAERGGGPAEGGAAGGLAEGDVEGVGVVDEGSVGSAVFSLHFLRVESFFREAEQAHGDWRFFK